LRFQKETDMRHRYCHKNRAWGDFLRCGVRTIREYVTDVDVIAKKSGNRAAPSVSNVSTGYARVICIRVARWHKEECSAERWAMPLSQPPQPIAGIDFFVWGRLCPIF
jgi:hypothetical protein